MKKQENEKLYWENYWKKENRKEEKFLFSEILKKCNISHKKFHSIRHTYASMLLKNGIDIETVAELMGHSTISITQIYLHSSNNQKKIAVNCLNNLL